MTLRVNAMVTETLMQIGSGELSINEMLVLLTLPKFGTVQAHVLAEELEGELTLSQVKKVLESLRIKRKVKRREHLRLGTIWKVA